MVFQSGKNQRADTVLSILEFPTHSVEFSWQNTAENPKKFLDNFGFSATINYIKVGEIERFYGSFSPEFFLYHREKGYQISPYLKAQLPVFPAIGIGVGVGLKFLTSSSSAVFIEYEYTYMNFYYNLFSDENSVAENPKAYKKGFMLGFVNLLNRSHKSEKIELLYDNSYDSYDEYNGYNEYDNAVEKVNPKKNPTKKVKAAPKERSNKKPSSSKSAKRKSKKKS